MCRLLGESMLNINNNTSNIKREILVRIAKLQLEGKLEEGVHDDRSEEL